MSPLVTVSIPTRNSSRTIKKCLKALLKQSYRKFEINIIDSYSTDRTVKIAKESGVRKIKIMGGSLLEARYEGAKMARGKYTLILDSDQILEKGTIERAVEMCEKGHYKMLALEELVLRSSTLLEKLFKMDRTLINKVNDLSPFTGVIMPRFFETKLLLQAYRKIPAKIFPHTGGPDHAIVYYEAWKLSKKIGVLPIAVKHIEPSSLRKFIPKFFRWGYTSVEAHFGRYNKLMNRKERFRTGLFTQGLIIESFGSIMLLILKGLPFKMGYYLAKFDREFGLSRRF